jgi:hypothetical protein
MKRIKLNLLLLLVMGVCGFSTSAHDFEVDGIYYEFDGNEAAVTYRGADYDTYLNEYSGDEVIPESVTYDGTTYPVTSIGAYAFSDCRYLTSVMIPNTVVAIGEWAFNGCNRLVSIPLPGSVTSIGEYAFYGCTSLASVTIPESLNTISNALFYGCCSLTCVTIPNSVTFIGPDAFIRCGLTSVAIPASVKVIGQSAFSNCVDLARIEVANDNPVFDSRNGCNAIIETATNTLVAGCKNTIIPNTVTAIGNCAFDFCTGLTSIVIPNSVISIGTTAFSHCSSLTAVEIPNSVSSIGVLAFSYCNALNSITVASDNPTYDSRDNCNALIKTSTNSLVAGCKNTVIPNSVTEIANLAFLNCYGLTSIEIPNSVTAIGTSAFSGCTNLASISIPNSVNTIGASAFYECSGLTSVTIPNSVLYIGQLAFDECYNITSVFLEGEGEWEAGKLPQSWSALYIDLGITEVPGMREGPADVFSFAVTPPLCDENSFTDYSGTLHVPAASVAAYFTAPYWCNFATIVGDAVKPDGLGFGQDSLQLYVNEIAMLTAAISPATATPGAIIWTSSNPAVATVIDGEVTAVAVGECDITAMCLGQRAVCRVVVCADCLTLDQQEVHVLPNHIVTLTPTSLAAELPALAVASSDPAVAAARVVNGTVQVVGVTEGTATITVGSADGTATPATCLVIVYSEHGDANCDGYIDVADVTALIDKVLGNEVTDFKDANGDINNDGDLDIEDVIALINNILGSE